MGKRRRNERQVIANALGIPRVHYCAAHNEKVKTFRLWPSKSMRYQCKEGCDLNKNETILKQEEVKKRR